MASLFIAQSDCIAYFFFFQAEDGIRDLTVTGVQTCALPISLRRDGRAARGEGGSLHRDPSRAGDRLHGGWICEGRRRVWRRPGGARPGAAEQDRKSVV